MTRPAPAPVHFLLVDDREENLLSLEALLRREGLVLLKARSGPEALELLLAHEVALALIDVQMPEMDGFELAELMRGTERTRRVPIIFLTAASPDQQRRFRGYEAGAVDFLTKPIEPHVLRSKADVFFELWRERQEVARQRDELRAATAENARLLEEMRWTAEALREADRKKDEFLATLAHELRNPLAPIRNGLQILSLAQNPETAARVRAMMERQLGHMVRLVDDLLDISRVTSGKVRLRAENVEVRAVIEAAVESSRPAVEAGEHSLAVQLPDERIWLHADPTRLAQVVGNLLTNAAKYTPNGGRIEVSAQREGGKVAIRVRDTGLGIPAEMLPRVFDLFAQESRTVERAQGGLGIGLTLVRRLVELHGGTVEADSEGEGLGSEFVVRLPVLAGGPSGGEGKKPSRPEHGPNWRILIVDDNVDSADSLAELLTLAGHDVRTAHDGPTALRVAQEQRAEVILLDIGLPQLSGYEVARRVRQNTTLRDTTLIAMTGYGQEEDRRKAHEAGFDYHLVKPVDLADVTRILNSIRNAARSGG